VTDEKKPFIYFTALPAAFAESTGNSDQYIEQVITEAYVFPVKPNTEEWKELKSTPEKVRVSQIPDSILYKLNTRALVETVLNYPLMPTIYAFNTKQKGFDAVLNSFNGLQELTKRDDALHELKLYQNELSTKEPTNKLSITHGIYINTLIESISTKKDASSSTPITNPQGTTISVITLSL